MEDDILNRIRHLFYPKAVSESKVKWKKGSNTHTVCRWWPLRELQQLGRTLASCSAENVKDYQKQHLWFTYSSHIFLDAKNQGPAQFRTSC